MKKPQAVLPRAQLIQEMHWSKVRFIPSIELHEDPIAERIYNAWEGAGKPERVNIYWKDQEEIVIRRRKRKQQ